MIMAHEGSHDITGFEHGCKHSCIDCRGAGILTALTDKWIADSRCGFIVFREGNVEESQCRQRFATVRVGQLSTFLSIPVDLIAPEPSITFQTVYGGICVAV